MKLFHLIDGSIPFTKAVWGQTHLILILSDGEELIIPYRTMEPVNQIENNASRLQMMERVASFEARNPDFRIEIES